MTGQTLEQTRVAKAAADAGFDLSPQEEDGWALFRSTAFPTVLGVGIHGDSAGPQYEVGVSDTAVGRRLCDEFDLVPVRESGRWAVSIEGVAGYARLHTMLMRAGALARVVGRAGLREFLSASLASLGGTEAVREVTQRVGQDIFRRTLIDYWGGKCAVTGLDVVELLRASHIKPWAACESDAERLDVFNGILLAPHLDALFDKGLVTFSDEGVLLRSPRLTQRQWEKLGLADRLLSPIALAERHRGYLAWHRGNLFRDGAGGTVHGG